MKISEQFPSPMTVDILAAALESLPGGAEAIQGAADQAVIDALADENV